MFTLGTVGAVKSQIHLAAVQINSLQGDVQILVDFEATPLFETGGVMDL